MRLGRSLAMAAVAGGATLAMVAPASASGGSSAVPNEAAMTGMKQVCRVMMRDTPAMEQAREAMMRNPAMTEMCERMMANNPEMGEKCESMMGDTTP